MSLSIPLAYGTDVHFFNCRASTDILTAGEPAVTIDEGQFQARLQDYLSNADFDLERTTIMVADKTRLCGYSRYLPVLLTALDNHGARMDRLTLSVAYGTHIRQTEAHSREAYGPAYAHARWVHHACDAPTDFVDLGRTRRGTPVRVPGHLIASGCRITFGAISHHYFAGFGGGRKLIFPGLGEREAIYANHSLFLDREQRRLTSGCRCGQLNGNPLAEDLTEYETFCPAHMAVHAILDSRGRVCDLLVGSGRDHFEQACARHAAHCQKHAGDYDLVLAACGGFPKDINFIQSHKAVHNAADFVRDGGRLIVLARCAEGIGSETFLPWFAMGGWDAAFDRLAAQYAGNGGTALAMMEKCRRIRISLVTDLDTDLTDQMGVKRLSLTRARQAVADHRGTMAVIPNASLLVRAPEHLTAA